MPLTSINPLVPYFITNLPVPSFTTRNIIVIGPAILELKYVHKFRLIDGHGVVLKWLARLEYAF